jgi:hypothetical protein
MAFANTLAFYGTAIIMSVKFLKAHALRVKIIKVFVAVINSAL